MREHESGAKEAAIRESRRPMSGNSLSARCKRLEENMLVNLSTMQAHRRGLEEVVQRRKEKAAQGQKEMMEEIKNSKKSMGSTGGSMLGIKPLNFQTMKERTASLLETSYENQDMLMSCRSILDDVTAAKAAEVAASQQGSARSQLPVGEASLEHDPAVGEAQAPRVDRCRIIEDNARQLQMFQAADATITDQDVTQFPADPEEEAQTATEIRQYILFGIRPKSACRALSMDRSLGHHGRPASAPAGNAQSRPSSSTSTCGARPPSASMYSRPQSASASAHAAVPRPASAASSHVMRPNSGRSGGPGVPSRPCSANSMRSRMKAMEDNVFRNKKILETNRDGIEIVKKRREQAAQAMTQLLLDLKPVTSDD
jgi:hypothetical protein